MHIHDTSDWVDLKEKSVTKNKEPKNAAASHCLFCWRIRRLIVLQNGKFELSLEKEEG